MRFLLLQLLIDFLQFVFYSFGGVRFLFIRLFCLLKFEFELLEDLLLHLADHSVLFFGFE